MKQTNNAIKFLMAQYRAIFKNAYFKGLTSAVLLTAGMAVASSAQADDIGAGADSWAEVITSNDITLSEEKTFSGSTATGSNRYYNNITINNGGTLKNSGAATISVKGDITVNSGGNLTLSGNTSHIAGFNLGATNDGSDDVPSTAVGTLYNKNGGTITIGGSDSNSLMQMQNVVFESGSTTTINGSGGTTNGNGVLVNSSYIMAGIGDTPGELTIDKGATVNINDYGYLGIASQGTMTVNGILNITATDTGSFAGIRATDAYNSSTNTWREDDANAKVILGKDAVITVKEGSGTAAILAPEVEINGSEINVESGSTFTFAGDVANTGNDSGSALTDGTGGASQVVMNSGKLNVNGTLVINNGSYSDDDPTTTEIDESKLITSLNIQGGELAGSGTVQVNGKLVASAKTLDTFLNGKDAEGVQNDGNFKFSGGNTIFEVTGSEQFDLAKYTFSGSGTTDFVLEGNGKIVGENLAVSKALTKDGSAASTDAQTKLTIEATNLTLGSDTYNGTASLNFSGATARNLTLLGSGNAFTLADDITLEAIDNVDNPFLTAKGTLKVAGEGQLNTEDTTTLSGGSLTIAAGHYSSNDNITLNSGSLTIGGQTSTADGAGVDASLTLTGNLTLDNTTNANTITISGNGVLPIAKDNGSTDRTATSTLDLTGVRDIEIKGNASNLTKFNVNGGGELLLSSNAFNNILDVADNNTQSGASIVISGGGYAYVDGSIQGANNNTALDVTKIVSGSAASSDHVIFSGASAGTLEARDTIWLEDTTGTDDLNLGSGELRAQTFRLDGHGTTTGITTTYGDFKVTSGVLTAYSRVESSHGNAIQLGNGTDSGATLNLGHIGDDEDEWGQQTHTYTTSAATGSVDTNLKLTGGTTSGQESKLNVHYGDWTAKDIEVTYGNIEVGNSQVRYDVNGEEVVFKASLTGNKLTMGTGSAATIHSNGKATFNELTMTAGTLNVNGEMIVNGKHVAANASANPAVTESWGIALGTGTDINVTGRNASLTFGSDAVSAITKSADGKSVTVATGTFTKNIDVTEFATLGLNFAEGTTFNAESLKSLRTALLSNSTNGAALTEGYINLGAATIEGVTVSPEGTIEWNNLKDFADIDQLQDIITEDMSNATLVNTNGSDTVQANVGNIQLDGNQQTVNLGDSYLANANAGTGNGNFIFNETNPTQAANANIVGGAHVTFANGGNVGAVSLAMGNGDGDGQTIFNVVSQNPEAVTNITSISAGTDTLVNISGNTEVAESIDADDLQVDADLTVARNVRLTGTLTDSVETIESATGSLTAANLTVDGETDYHGDLNITGSTDFNSYASLNGDNTFGTSVTFDSGAELNVGTTTANRVVLNGTYSTLSLAEGASLNAQLVETEAGQTIQIGRESSSEVGYTGEEPWDSSAGYFFADRVDLNGATIMADPAFGQAASMVGIGRLGDINVITTGNDAGTLDGKVISLRNAIMAIGVNDTEEATVQEQLQSTFAQYLDANGSLSADGVGSILYVADALDVNDGSKLIVDAKRRFTTFNEDSAATAANSYGDIIRKNDVYIGENSALAIGEDAALYATNANAPRAALDFNKSGASLYAEKNAKILLVGSDFSIHSNIHLFSDNDGGIMINGNNVTVSTLNNLLIDVLEQGKEAGDINLSLNRDAVDSAFYAASAPVKNTLISYAANDLNWADTSTTHETQQLLGDRVAGVTWNGTNYIVTEGETERALSSEESANLTYDVVGYDENDRPVYGVFEKGYNYFLEQVARDSRSGAEAETVARLAVFGGAAQAAISAGASTYDAVSGRMGVGANGANITVADNTQGAALWLAPIYKSSDSDGFDAEGVDYGVDMDLYGVALGADYTLSNGIRFGAMFNVGSGDIDGQGAGSAVSNDFDYYGFAVYGGYSMGALSVVADVSYTVADNDLEGNTAIDKVGASLDSTNLSIGVTGQYQLDFNGTTVTPHAGLRFSCIDLDDYTIDGEDVIADYDADSMNIFSIPVGVTFAKEFTSDTWTVKPSLDLTLTGNFGDDETDGTVHWAGVENLSTNVSSEVVDNFTYGATLGVAAKTGNFSLGLGVNYTGSSNVDEFGVQANARFVF